jgi:hypothetical protein
VHRVRTERDARAGRLFGDDRGELERLRAATAELLRSLDPEDTQFAEPVVELAWWVALLLPVVVHGSDLATDEVAYDFAESLMFLVEHCPKHCSSIHRCPGRDGATQVRIRT